MDAIKLDVKPRETGKRAAKAIRRAEEVPCVLYGHHTDPVHFRVPALDLRPLIYTAETHRVELALDGEAYDCIVKQIDFHPVTDMPIHADFLALTEGETIDLTIPVVTVGTATTVGSVTSARGGEAEVALQRPVCARPGVNIAINRRVGARWRLIGYGTLQ